MFPVFSLLRCVGAVAIAHGRKQRHHDRQDGAVLHSHEEHCDTGDDWPGAFVPACLSLVGAGWDSSDLALAQLYLVSALPSACSVA